MPPFDVMDAGRMTVLADPAGAVFGVWQAGRHRGAELANEPGSLCWNELLTSDPDKAVSFLTAIGGFTHDAMAMPQGVYHVLHHDGAPRAGVTAPAMAGVPNAWLPYVQVASADQTAAKATKLGASIKVPPTDIPNVGRFAIFTDVNGAAIGILQPAAR